MTGETKTVPDWTRNNENLSLCVSRAEIEQRRDKVLEGMNRDGIDVAVFTTPETIFYLTGIALNRYCYQPLLISATGEHRYICRYIDAAWQDVWGPQSWASNWVSVRDHDDVTAVVAQLIQEIQPKSKSKPVVGFELDRASISYNGVLRIRELVGAASVVSCTRIAEDLRVIKSPAELDLMRRAGKISALLSDTIADAIRAGATDAEASIAAGQICNEHSGTPRPAPTVHTGAAAGNGHMTAWTNRRPEPGESVTWHVSGFVHNYACPIERTIIRGPDINKIGSLVEAAARAVEKMVAELRPGMTSAEAHNVCLRAHQASGVDHLWRNHAGYSTGINWVEFDLFRIRPKDERPLRPGMTLHLVPCLTVPGLTNAQGSRVILITENGAEELNDHPIFVPGFE
ncbi:M24 family metallopeptidase [Mesorhizobium sp. 1B3]|uniref:M24 family metallopeptidase n=1 Tax=Mesorhizobium sp. 1B3 TaxID=3243599 RepID=UPI003D972A30